MPQITSIEPQRKRNRRFNIYLGGEFAFGVDEDTLVRNNLKTGKKLSSKQVEKIIKESELSKLIDKSLKFLSYRPRSEMETINYLAKKISQKESIDFQKAAKSPLVDQAITKLKKYKYLDDLQFAKWWIKSRANSNPKGIVLIKKELFQKGISRETVESAFSNYPNQRVLAKRAIERKLRNWHSFSEVEFKKKTYGFLARRGFEAEIIKEIVAYFIKKR